jgi:hypothetical protein
MHLVGFEPTTAVFERSKLYRVLDSSANVTGKKESIYIIFHFIYITGLSLLCFVPFVHPLLSSLELQTACAVIRSTVIPLIAS